jgi:hypothetical protein
MSLLEKVSVPRPRPAAPTPRERLAWINFQALAGQFQDKGQAMSPIVRAELKRLIAKGNPLAIRFQERLDLAGYRPRAPHEAPLPPPPRRRVRRLKWGSAPKE